MNQCLSQHPDQPMVHYIINGLINGFDIGYSTSSLKNCNHNLISATEHENAVTTAINKELDRGHMSGSLQHHFQNSTVHHLAQGKKGWVQEPHNGSLATKRRLNK